MRIQSLDSAALNCPGVAQDEQFDEALRLENGGNPRTDVGFRVEDPTGFEPAFPA